MHRPRWKSKGIAMRRGTGEYNLALGAKRAQTAKDYLVTLGVPAERFTTVTYGKELPVCREHTEECWQKNRHDRFVVKNVPQVGGYFLTRLISEIKDGRLTKRSGGLLWPTKKLAAQEVLLDVSVAEASKLYKFYLN